MSTTGKEELPDGDFVAPGNDEGVESAMSCITAATQAVFVSERDGLYHPCSPSSLTRDERRLEFLLQTMMSTSKLSNSVQPDNLGPDSHVDGLPSGYGAIPSVEFSQHVSGSSPHVPGRGNGVSGTDQTGKGGWASWMMWRLLVAVVDILFVDGFALFPDCFARANATWTCVLILLWLDDRAVTNLWGIAAPVDMSGREWQRSITALKCLKSGAAWSNSVDSAVRKALAVSMFDRATGGPCPCSGEPLRPPRKELEALVEGLAAINDHLSKFTTNKCRPKDLGVDLTGAAKWYNAKSLDYNRVLQGGTSRGKTVGAHVDGRLFPVDHGLGQATEIIFTANSANEQGQPATDGMG
jgi:hypothetical protein